MSVLCLASRKGLEWQQCVGTYRVSSGRSLPLHRIGLMLFIACYGRSMKMINLSRQKQTGSTDIVSNANTLLLLIDKVFQSLQFFSFVL